MRSNAGSGGNDNDRRLWWGAALLIATAAGALAAGRFLPSPLVGRLLAALAAAAGALAIALAPRAAEERSAKPVEAPQPARPLLADRLLEPTGGETGP